MKKHLVITLLLICANFALAQMPAYRLILKNDTLVSPTSLQFEIYLERSGSSALELAALQPIMTFNTGIVVDSLTFTVVGGFSELNPGQQPTNAKLSISGNELRIAAFPPPGTGSGSLIPVAPGSRVGRFQLTSSAPFPHQRASIVWKSSGTNPLTKLNAYVGGVDTAITDTASHFNELDDPVLSPITITTASPLPSATAGIPYLQTLDATGGTIPYIWSVVNGSLPPGLSLLPAGIISGTTTTAGAFSFAAGVIDNVGASASKQFALDVIPGPATHLSFVQQPSSASAGAFISPPITVQLRDLFENSVPSAGDTVTMALFSGTGILSGTKSRLTDASGLASFNDLSVSLIGSKRLRATHFGISPDTSNSFTIVPGSPSSIVFMQNPTDAVSDAIITPPVAAQIRDSLGNNVHTSGIVIEMSIASGTGILSGTISQPTDTNGIARFPDLSVDLVGEKTLSAGGAGLTSVQSAAFTISAGPAAQVRFNQQPTNTVAGVNIAPTITVQLRDAAGNTVGGSGVQIVASLIGSGNLGGQLNRNTGGAGQASFNNLNIDSAGTKRLRATSAGLAPDTSAFFTISPGPAVRLAYLQQPSSGPAGSAISPPVVLQLKDAIGNDVQHAGDSIFISLSSGTGTLTGTTRQTTNNSGNASFGDLVINQGGVKTLTAAGPGLTSLQSASFTLSAYTISATGGPNGTISPSGSVIVFPGGDQLFTISPNTGYHIDSVIVDGASVGPVGAYSFTNVTANHTIRTVYAIDQFTITATTGLNGSITPSGSVVVGFGANQSFTITPDTGYHVDSVIVDGSNLGAPGSYTFTNVTAPHTIRAVFAIDQFTITATTGPNGAMLPNGPALVNYGASQSYTITPNSGYHVDSVIVDGVNVGPVGAYTFTNVTANHTIRTVYAINQFTITATTGPNGSISPSGSVNANSGGTQAFTITPNAGYHVDSVIVDGTNQGSLTTYAFTNITANHTIRAVFAPNAILVTIQTVPAGMQMNVDNVLYASPHAFSWIAGQSHSITVLDTIAGGTGRRFVWSSWSDSGAKSHLITPLVNTTYTAGFTTQFFLTMSANTGGTVAPPSGWRDSASVVTIRAFPGPKYQFNIWSGTGSGSYSFDANPATVTMNAPISETANFRRLPIQITVNTSPDGRTFVYDGTPFTTQQTFTITPGTEHFLDIYNIVQSDGTPGKQYLWTAWSDGGAKAHSVTPDNDTTITALFTTQFFLTMIAKSGGSVAPPSGWQDSGHVVGITATPSAGYTFAGWSGVGNGSYTGSANPSTVTMNAPIRDTASFTQFPVYVTIQSSPAGREIVVDGVHATAPQSYIWTSLSNHTIATVDSQESGGTRYIYRAWSDGGAMTHGVAPDRDSSFTVFFNRQYYLTMGVDSGGTVAPSSGYRDSGSVVNISAAPASGFVFSNWTGSGTGSYSGASNPVSVTMGSPISETAHFGRFSVQVTVQTVPAGLTVVVDSVAYTSPQTFTWTTGSAHTVSTIAIQTSSAGTRQVWSTWSDSGALTHIVTPSSPTTLTANFTTQYFLTMNANPGGTVSPASNWFNSGQVVQINAIPDSAHYFNLWTGVGAYAYSGGANPANILMFGPAIETANFIRRPVTIVIQANPAGRPFIYDGVTYTDPQTRSVQPGEQHFLNVVSPQAGAPGTQYIFANWSDGGAQNHSILPDSDAAYTVNFTRQYYLTIAAGAGGTATPASGWHDSGEVVTISATPNFTYSFTGWRGSGSGSYSGPDNPATVTMNGPISDTAGFTQNPVHVTIQTTPPGRRFTIDGIDDSTSQTYVWIAGSTHSLAAPDTELAGTGTRHVWQNWSDGGARIHNIAPTRDTTITVTFATQYYLTMIAGSGGTVTPQSGWRASGAIVTISAQPNPTYTFGGWNGTGSISYTGTSNPSSVTMNSPITESASFVQTPVSVAFTTQPDGRHYIVDGIEYSKAEVFTWNSGSLHTISVPTPQGGIEGVQYAWKSWSDGRALTHSISPTTDSAFTAGFITQFMLTMMSDSGGSVLPASGWQDSGKIVQLTAIPAAEYQFTGWNGTGPGEYTGMSNPVAIRIDGPITQVAGFSRFDAEIIIATSPPSRKVIVDGLLYTTPISFSWVTGSLHSIAVADTQTASGGSRYLWTSWSDGKPISHTITVQKDSTFTAYFSTQYFLTMSVNIGGTTDPTSGWFNAGQIVTITGVPDTGFVFSRWVGTGNGAYDGFNNPATVTVNGPISELANFRYLPVHVSITTNPPGRLYTYDGTTYLSPQTFTIDRGTLHNLDAPSPQPIGTGMQYVWSSWSDSGDRAHTIFPNTDVALTANFDLQYALTVNVTPAFSGITAPSGTTFYNEGDTVQVTANPASGYAFSSWSGGIVSTDNPVNVILNSPKSVTAHFASAAVVNVATVPAGRNVTVDGIDYVAPKSFSWIKGSPHTISTTATQTGASGTQYAWSSWNDRGARTHTVSPSGDTSFVANFITQHYLTVTSSTGGHVTPPSGWVNEGVPVALHAFPDSGYHLVEWVGSGSGSYSGTNDTATISLSGPVTQDAAFGVILPGPFLAGIPDKSTGIPTSPLLSWMTYAGGTSYRLQVSADSIFASVVFDSTGIADTACRVPILANLIKYHWRVNARVPGNITSYSGVRSFTTMNASIAVGSQGVNWGTGYTYPINWNSTDLSGPVRILLSLNNGLSVRPVEDSLSGNGTYHWKVPDSASYISSTCRIRVTSSLNPQIFAESNVFAIVAGALPITIPVSAVLPFPQDPYASTDYRLISIPGIADTFKVGTFISGTQVKEWRMFADNGAAEDYLDELSSDSPLSTGTGYWLVKKGNLQIPSFAMIVPPLSPDATYPVPVIPGWNIVANPYSYTIPWKSVLDASGLSPTAEISAYNGAYESSAVLEPFKAYYFFNDGSAQALKMQYPFGQALPSSGTAQPPAAGMGWKLQLAYSSGINRDEENFIGVARGTQHGMDALDSRKPPAFLDQDFLCFTRPEWDARYPRFNKDLRPSIAEGQEWKFEISNPRKSSSVLEIRGLEDVPAGYRVVLINEDNSVPVDLRQHASVAFQPARKVTAMKILVGTKEFVDREVSKLLPAEFDLAQNFPNPFNPVTSIGVKLPQESSIRLEVYSILGQRVKVLADGQFAAGTHTFVWAGTDESGNVSSSGIYVYRLSANGKTIASKKMVLAK